MKKLINNLWERFVCSPIGCLLMLPMLYDSRGAYDDLDKLAEEQGVKRQSAQEPTFKDDENK